MPPPTAMILPGYLRDDATGVEVLVDLHPLLVSGAVRWCTVTCLMSGGYSPVLHALCTGERSARIVIDTHWAHLGLGTPHHGWEMRAADPDDVARWVGGTLWYLVVFCALQTLANNVDDLARQTRNSQDWLRPGPQWRYPAMLRTALRDTLTPDGDHLDGPVEVSRVDLDALADRWAPDFVAAAIALYDRCDDFPQDHRHRLAVQTKVRLFVGDERGGEVLSVQQARLFLEAGVSDSEARRWGVLHSGDNGDGLRALAALTA